MLEFKKRILQKVSFDITLFENELKKAIAWLDATDANQLREWAYKQFSNRFHAIIDKCYSTSSVLC